MAWRPTILNSDRLVLWVAAMWHVEHVMFFLVLIVIAHSTSIVVQNVSIQPYLTLPWSVSTQISTQANSPYQAFQWHHHDINS